MLVLILDRTVTVQWTTDLLTDALNPHPPVKCETAPFVHAGVELICLVS